MYINVYVFYFRTLIKIRNYNNIFNIGNLEI